MLVSAASNGMLGLNPAACYLRSEGAPDRRHLSEHGFPLFGLFPGRQQPVENGAALIGAAAATAARRFALGQHRAATQTEKSAFKV